MTTPELPALGTPPGGVLSDIIKWVRRILKSQSDQEISDGEIVNYINRFYQFDMPARVQLFELKRQYTFETIPNIFIYQPPLQATALNDGENIDSATQGYAMLMAPAYCDGIQLGFFQSNSQFYTLYPETVMNEKPTLGDGSRGPYTITFAQSPVLRGFRDDLNTLTPYVFFTTENGSGGLQYVVDNGEGSLFATDSTFQYGPGGIGNEYIGAGNVDYENGTASVVFADPVPDGQQIYCQSSPYSAGFPRIMLYFNNTIKLYPVPDRPYKITMDAYITPAQFLSTTDSVPFAYMAEYIARGAARKALSDVADIEQFNFYEGLFREQENNVLRRTNRQQTISRTPTIFSTATQQNGYFFRPF